MTQTLEPKSKRVYKPRRDWRKEMETLAAYCEMSIAFIAAAAASDRMAADQALFWDGQAVALKAVLAKIERKP